MQGLMYRHALQAPVLEMNPETKAITPTDYMGVKLVSFGFANQGSAIMRGAMVSGVVHQLLTTAEVRCRQLMTVAEMRR